MYARVTIKCRDYLSTYFTVYTTHNKNIHILYQEEVRTLSHL